VPPPAYGGGLILRKSPEQLTLEAESVVVARVENVAVRFTASLESIETVVTLRVEQTVTGSPPARITLVLPGGAIGDLRVMAGGVPNFWPGERTLLFLRGVHGAPTLAGAWQGKYSLVGNVATQPESGHRMTLAALGSRIAQAIATPFTVADDDTPTVASAPFQLFCVPWNTGQVPVPHSVNAAGPGVGAPTGTNFVKLVQRGFQAWQDVPTAWFSARIVGTTTRTATNHMDGLHDVAWSNLDSFGSGVLGVNFCVTNSGGRFDSDTLLDNTGTFWSTNAAPGTIDLDSVLRHEFGHGLGLGHSDAVPCDGGGSTPLMCPFISFGAEKTILADDSNGLVFQYPLVGAPPIAPSGLVATQASDTSVALQWNEVGGELGYEVQRATGGCAGPFQAINSVPANGPLYTDTDLGGGLPQGTYCYRVKALGRGGDSGFSNAAPVALVVVFKGGVFVATGRIDGIAGAEIVTGPDAGGGPHVRVFRPDGVPVGSGFLAYPASFTGGVRVAACDFDGDGRDEIVTGAGPGGGAHVRVLKMSTAGLPIAELASFLAYGVGFTGGVFVACGNVEGIAGSMHIVTGAGAGGSSHTRVLRYSPGAPGGGVVPVFELLPYGFFGGGVHVAAGDVDGSGRASIITGPGPGGGPHIRVLKAVGGSLTSLGEFFAYPPAFTGGAWVAAGNVTGGTAAEVITGSGPGGGPQVRVFAANGTEVAFPGFLAYPAGFTGGVRVAAGNLDATGLGEIVTATGPGGGPHVLSFTAGGVPTGTSFFAY
jgi:hypothetical protein